MSHSLFPRERKYAAIHLHGALLSVKEKKKVKFQTNS